MGHQPATFRELHLTHDADARTVEISYTYDRGGEATTHQFKGGYDETTGCPPSIDLDFNTEAVEDWEESLRTGWLVRNPGDTTVRLNAAWFGKLVKGTNQTRGGAS